MVAEAGDVAGEGEEFVAEGGGVGVEFGVVGVLGVVGSAPCCGLGWMLLVGGVGMGWEETYIRAGGYLGRTFW